MKALLVGGLLLTAISALFSIISVAIPYWVNETGAHYSGYFGLWQYCVETDLIKECTSFTEVKGWMQGVRAMSILGVICLCLCSTFASVFARSTNRMFAFLSICLAIVGGICCLIAAIVFGAKESEFRSHFGAGFVLTIVTAIIAFLSAVIMALAQRMTSGYTSF